MGLLLWWLQIDRMQWCWPFMSARVILMLTVLMSLDLLPCNTLDSSSSSTGGSVLTERVCHGSGIQRLDDDIVFFILLTLHQHRQVLRMRGRRQIKCLCVRETRRVGDKLRKGGRICLYLQAGLI